MSDTSELLRHYLSEHWEHVYVDAATEHVVFPHTGDGACWWVRAAVDEERGALTVTSHCPVFTPRDRLAEMCELLQRCHNEIICGHFRLDFRDGEITFCTGLFFGPGGIDVELVRHVVEGNLSSVQYFLPSLMAVAYGNATPATALELPVWPERLLAAEVEADLEELLGEVEVAPGEASCAPPMPPPCAVGEGTPARSPEARENLKQRLLALLASLQAELDQPPGRRPPQDIGGAAA